MTCTLCRLFYSILLFDKKKNESIKSQKRISHIHWNDQAYQCFFFAGNCSRKSPRKTSAVPITCRTVSRLPKMNTEQRIVKNLRVVVTIEHVNGPNHSIVRKMKFCKKHNEHVRRVFRRETTHLSYCTSEAE